MLAGLKSEMFVGSNRRYPASGRPLEESFLDQEWLVHLFESLGISVASNPALTAIKTGVAYLQETSARLLAVTEQGKGNVIEMTVPDDFPATGIMDLAHIDDVIIAAIVRRRRTIVPRGRDRIEPGDRLLIFATQEATESVEQYFA